MESLELPLQDQRMEYHVQTIFIHLLHESVVCIRRSLCLLRLMDADPDGWSDTVLDEDLHMSYSRLPTSWSGLRTD
ncbi:hypothetical protein ACHAPX_008205 [Trichoderma viride]